MPIAPGSRAVLNGPFAIDEWNCAMSATETNQGLYSTNLTMPPKNLRRMEASFSHDYQVGRRRREIILAGDPTREPQGKTRFGPDGKGTHHD
jgi:hypothetical protein